MTAKNVDRKNLTREKEKRHNGDSSRSLNDE